MPVKGFSTGMKKKVALIRAMLHKPRILLLNEPTNGLDPVSTTDLRNMLLELAREHGTTIIMTTHNLEEVQKMCDKISIFRHGQTLTLLVGGAPRELTVCGIYQDLTNGGRTAKVLLPWRAEDVQWYLDLSEGADRTEKVTARADRVLFMTDGYISGESPQERYRSEKQDWKAREETLSVWLSNMGF